MATDVCIAAAARRFDLAATRRGCLHHTYPGAACTGQGCSRSADRSAPRAMRGICHPQACLLPSPPRPSPPTRLCTRALARFVPRWRTAGHLQRCAPQWVSPSSRSRGRFWLHSSEVASDPAVWRPAVAFTAAVIPRIFCAQAISRQSADSGSAGRGRCAASALRALLSSGVKRS
eukprot:3052208-Prymnesium_polylepis.1